LKKIPIFISILGFIFGCSSSDEGGIDCTLYDPAFPSLHIRIVDSAGTNLIDNGVIDPNNISVEGDFPNAQFQIVPDYEFVSSDPDNGALNYSLSVVIPRKATFKYTINLADINTTYSFDFTAKLMHLPCDISFFTPVKGSSNNQQFKLLEVRPLQFVGDLKIQNY